MKKNLICILVVSILLANCAVKPTASFTVPAQKFVAPVEVSFTNTTKFQAESYRWDFGDGSTSSEANPSHRYTQSGNYAVVLNATKGSKTIITKQMIQVTAPETCLVEIETDFGNMTVELYNATPKHRDNFIKLAESGYYNDLLFHRVMAGFMIQGGDPESRNAPAGKQLGMGGPPYQIPAEFVDSIIHLKGAICAAHNGNPEKKSAGSQFYIVQGSTISDAFLNQVEIMGEFHYTPEQRAAYLEVGGTPQLDRGYTVFGRVIKGLEVIDKIAATETDAHDRPKKDVKMKVHVIK